MCLESVFFSGVMRPGFAHDSFAMKYDIVCSKEIPGREGRLVRHNIPPPRRCRCCRASRGEVRSQGWGRTLERSLKFPGKVKSNSSES